MGHIKTRSIVSYTQDVETPATEAGFEGSTNLLRVDAYSTGVVVLVEDEHHMATIHLNATELDKVIKALQTAREYLP